MFRFSSLFCDGAILQREVPLPVWGWCKPFVKVECSLGAQKAVTQCADDGKFLVWFPPVTAGEPLELRACRADTGESIVSKDVLLGEVWLAGGQSNMGLPVTGIPAELAEKLKAFLAGGPPIRRYRVPMRTRLSRVSDPESKWEQLSPESCEKFTAVGAFFAKRLFEELRVPIGIIGAYRGATRIEAWSSPESLCGNPDTETEFSAVQARLCSKEFFDRLSEAEFDPEEERQPELAEIFERSSRPAIPPGNPGLEQGWNSPVFDDSQWKNAVQPARWKNMGFPSNGIVWMRRRFEIPADWRGVDLTLELGCIDKQDITYFNGVEIGRTGKDYESEFWNRERNYSVPGDLVQGTGCLIAVRAASFAFDGGMIGPGEKMRLYPRGRRDAAIGLDGDWKFHIELDVGRTGKTPESAGPANPNTPSILFDNMIHPLIPFAIRGVIWYQGEENDNRPEPYRRLVENLILDWRRRWRRSDLPFLQTLLAKFGAPAPYDRQSTWALLREAQSLAGQDTGNLTASAVDVGEAENIHPGDKETAGCRLALAALEQAYRRRIVGSGPVLDSREYGKESVRLHFSHVGDGLRTTDGDRPKGFFIAGENSAFRPAEAEICGNAEVRVFTGNVALPVFVRYAWADNPSEMNLCNSAGLPAVPFRTDRFPFLSH